MSAIVSMAFILEFTWLQWCKERETVDWWPLMVSMDNKLQDDGDDDANAASDVVGDDFVCE